MTFKAEIIRLAKQGSWTDQQIADKVGTTKGTVSGAKYRARMNKELCPPRKKESYASFKFAEHAAGRRIGSIAKVFESLTREQMDWSAMRAQQMGCDHIAEYLAELVRDDHAGEVEALKAKLAVATKALGRANDLLKERGIPMVEQDA